MVDVLVDGEKPIRGIYCGLHKFPSGRLYAEILLDDEAWEFVCLEIPHAVWPVRESHSLVIHDEEERLDAADNQQVPPWPHHDLRLLLGLLAASAVGWIALFLHVFPFVR